MAERHPGGRTCQLGLLMLPFLMPYALFRYWRDGRANRA